jgi:hypothetical protein
VTDRDTRLDFGIIVWISIQSHPFNLNACGAAVKSVNSDNRLAAACGRAAVRPHAAVWRVKNGPKYHCNLF